MLLTKSLALDYTADNIRVNCVCPGVVDTPWCGSTWKPAETPKRERAARTPLERFLSPEESARAAQHLFSDEAEDITGIAHVVDGGLLASFEYDRSWTVKEKHLKRHTTSGER